jgi:Bacterial flagellin N-terminal helical region
MVSTGLRISSAADKAAYWSIATKKQSNIGALGAVNDALSESIKDDLVHPTLPSPTRVTMPIISARTSPKAAASPSFRPSETGRSNALTMPSCTRSATSSSAFQQAQTRPSRRDTM